MAERLVGFMFVVSVIGLFVICVMVEAMDMCTDRDGEAHKKWIALEIELVCSPKTTVQKFRL